MKKCPFCAEEIKDEAIVCKHCNRDLKQNVNKTELKNPRIGKKKIVVGNILFILGIIFGLPFFVMGITTPSASSIVTGVIIILPGIIIGSIGRFQHWYHWK